MRPPLDFFREQAFRNDPEVMTEYELACVLQDIVQEYHALPLVVCPSCEGDGEQGRGSPRYTRCVTCHGMGQMIDD